MCSVKSYSCYHDPSTYSCSSLGDQAKVISEVIFFVGGEGGGGGGEVVM